MADQGLIQGARYAYGAGTSAGAAMRQANIARPVPGQSQARQMAAMQAQAKKRFQANQIKTQVKNYVDSIPADFDVSQIPDRYRGDISAKLLELKAKAAQAARDITQYQPGEVGYQQNVDIINGVKNAMNNMKTQWDGFGASKKDFLENETNNNYSRANDPEGKMSTISRLYTDNLNVRIGDDGNLFFSGDNIEEFNFNTAEQDAPFNKAAKEAQEFLQLNKNIYNSGKKISNAESLMYENAVGNLLDRGGWEVSQSFLKDDLFGNTTIEDTIKNQTFNIGGRNYSYDQAMELANGNDPAVSVDAREVINDAIKGSLMTNLNNSANAGYKEQNIKSNKENNNKENVMNFDVNAFFKESYGLPVYNKDENGNPVPTYNIDLGENPAASDLGIQLGNAGYTFYKGDDGDVTYMVDGMEVDAKDAGALAMAKIRSEYGLSKFNNLSDAEKEKVLSQYIKRVPGAAGGYYIKPGSRFGGTASERSAYAIKINPNDPNSIQNALNRLSKLKLKD